MPVPAATIPKLEWIPAAVTGYILCISISVASLHIVAIRNKISTQYVDKLSFVSHFLEGHSGFHKLQCPMISGNDLPFSSSFLYYPYPSNTTAHTRYLEFTFCTAELFLCEDFVYIEVRG